jgi:hypothetical protein
MRKIKKLENFPTKWSLVRRRKCEKIKELERRFRSIRSKNALDRQSSAEQGWCKPHRNLAGSRA